MCSRSLIEIISITGLWIFLPEMLSAGEGSLNIFFGMKVHSSKQFGSHASMFLAMRWTEKTVPRSGFFCWTLIKYYSSLIKLNIPVNSLSKWLSDEKHFMLAVVGAVEDGKSKSLLSCHQV